MIGSIIPDPYIGPRPFERNLEDEKRFFGRDHETEDIVALILSHPLVLIYGPAGVGKTSLFNTTIYSALKDRGFQVLPVAQVRGIVPDNIEIDTIKNPYIFFTLQSLMPEIDPMGAINKSLSDFLKDFLVDKKGHTYPRLLVFDQIEEVFNIYWERLYEMQIHFFGFF